jgi:GH25 family lysozyme M1 (1,4-beta-N-acetylmuramidase)
MTPQSLFPVNGIDTSEWEGLLDCSKTAAAAHFISVKANEGEYTDPQFLNTWTHAKQFGLKRTAFCFLTIRDSIRNQAKKFAELLKDDPGEIEPYADFEEGNTYSVKKNPFTGKRGRNHLSFGELSGFIFYFKEALKVYYPVWPWKYDIGVYSGYSYWEQYGTKDPAFTVHPLWVSEPDPVVQPSALQPWSLGQWRFWQTDFAGNAASYGIDPKVAKGVDLDVYNGTLEQFNADYGGGVTPAPLPVKSVTLTEFPGYTFDVYADYSVRVR